MEPKRNSIGPGIVLLLALVIGGWFLQQGLAQDGSVMGQARLFDDIIDHIADRYVDEVDRDDLYDYAIEGVLEQLGDPNTSVFNTNEFEDFRIQTEGDYGGVGLEIADQEAYITVVSPLQGAPGSRAGIRAGDRIVRVEDESTEEWSAQHAVQVLRGRPGSSVGVTIRRPGIEEPIDFTLTRERIQIRSVPFSLLLDGSVAYVPLRVFSETSTREVRAAADSLRDAGAAALILDLRSNPGGVLDEGVGVTDLFLDRGAGVVETRGDEGGPNGMIRASTGDRYEGMPVVVLVDRGSASASEIVAGALQDHDRALLIGSSTFGKGSVQSLFNLTGGNVLKLTTARWYTPLGRSIERPPSSGSGSGSPGEHLPITVTGQFALPADTAGRPTVTSEAGRTLFGGGGIVPDVLVPMDTLSTVEQAAVRTLFRDAGVYNGARFDLAVQYLQEHPGLDLDFRVEDQDLADVYDRLVGEDGVDLTRETFALTERFVRYDLQREIALQGWGELGELQRAVPYDDALQVALDLLRGATSTEELFTRAGGPLPALQQSISAAASGP
jgi:carboxyl-terminal processing protease